MKEKWNKTSPVNHLPLHIDVKMWLLSFYAKLGRLASMSEYFLTKWSCLPKYRIIILLQYLVKKKIRFFEVTKKKMSIKFALQNMKKKNQSSNAFSESSLNLIPFHSSFNPAYLSCPFPLPFLSLSFYA